MAIVDNPRVDMAKGVGSSICTSLGSSLSDFHPSNKSDLSKRSLIGGMKVYHPDSAIFSLAYDHPIHVYQCNRIVPPGFIACQRQAAGTEADGEGFGSEMRDLEELLSKLNPMAKKFVPPSLAKHPQSGECADFDGVAALNGSGNDVISKMQGRRKKNCNVQGKRRMNSRTSLAQRDEIIKRTVYVSDIDQHITEEQLAALFVKCGQVVDCRICGDPNSVLRFAFVEFTDEASAKAALRLAGTMLGYYPVRVLPSKTAIAPVNPTFLPRSEDERDMCARTIYCTNIDKKVTQADVKVFFEYACGQVYRLRLLGDSHHSARIAFVEFVMAESAIAALNCSGVVLGSLPIRVSPSKTPVRPQAPLPTPIIH